MSPISNVFRRAETGLVTALFVVMLGSAGSWQEEREGVDRRIAELRAEITGLRAELDGLLLDRREEALEAETESIRPGVNDTWASEDVDELRQILEKESREVWEHREALAAITGPRPGAVVADVGAGSGFLSELFAERVGPEGRVIAVDINPHMMEELAERARAEGIANLETHVGSERSIDLPRHSVDLVFVCDTYHHFEYPRSTLRSIHEALRPGGQLVVVELHRIPGKTKERILNHVRAGEEVFTAEIEAAGFELSNKHDLPDMEENYILRFRRVGP